MDDHALATTIKDRRRRLGVTQEEAAALAGCSPRFISALESGKPSVRLDKLLAVLDALGLELRVDLRRPR